MALTAPAPPANRPPEIAPPTKAAAGRSTKNSRLAALSASSALMPLSISSRTIVLYSDFSPMIAMSERTFAYSVASSSAPSMPACFSILAMTPCAGFLPARSIPIKLSNGIFSARYSAKPDVSPMPSACDALAPRCTASRALFDAAPIAAVVRPSFPSGRRTAVCPIDSPMSVACAASGLISAVMPLRSPCDWMTGRISVLSALTAL